jgi:uncharacterized membrane protein HdeD (DUF308 family)/uncharacterized protein YbjT (DUF2867 family)
MARQAAATDFRGARGRGPGITGFGLPEHPLPRARRWLQITGVLSIVAGILALVVPAAASVATSVFIGWILVFAGLVMTAHAIPRRSEPHGTARLLTAALTLVAGLYLLVFPLSGTVTLTFILAVWFFAIGLLELMVAVPARGLPGSGFMIFNGAVSVILGILIAVSLPSSASWAIGLLVGINLLIWGARAMVVAAALKRFEEMDVLVVGGHGKVGLRLLGLLAANGHRARGLIRRPEHSADLEAVGAEPAVLDIERDEITPAARGADAVVFAAGAGPGSGPERKKTVDLGGALKLIDAAKANGVRRYVMVSSMGADRPPPGTDGMAPYLQAKAAADRALIGSGLDCTIVRPGGLTDEPGTGRIAAAEKLGRRGSVSRDDVAATLFVVLGAPNTIGKTFELLAGETPMEEAIAAL